MTQDAQDHGRLPNQRHQCQTARAGRTGQDIKPEAALHQVRPSAITWPHAKFSALAPFGPGNPKPRFHTGPVSVVDGPRILKDRHLKMSVKQDGRVLRAIQWNAAEQDYYFEKQLVFDEPKGATASAVGSPD